MRTYGTAPCPFCGKDVSRAGVGTYRHRMVHVRRGEALAFRVLGSGEVFFTRPDEPPVSGGIVQIDHEGRVA